MFTSHGSPNEKPLMIKYGRPEPVPAFFLDPAQPCEDVMLLSTGLVLQVKDNDNGLLGEGGGSLRGLAACPWFISALTCVSCEKEQRWMADSVLPTQPCSDFTAQIVKSIKTSNVHI